MNLSLKLGRYCQHPFGMLMPGRIYASEAYSWGFNGQEKDDAILGSGNNLDFGARIYDSRLGRWMSVDPLFNHPKNTSLSPYNFAVNSPLLVIDKDGRLWFLATAVAGAVINVGIGLVKGESSWQQIGKNFIVGAVAGVVAGIIPVGAAALASGSSMAVAATFSFGEMLSALGGAGFVMTSMAGSGLGTLAGSVLDQGIDILSGKRTNFDEYEIAFNVAIGIGTGVFDVPLNKGKDIIEGTISKWFENSSKKEIKEFEKNLAMKITQKAEEAGVTKIEKKSLEQGVKKATEHLKTGGVGLTLRMSLSPVVNKAGKYTVDVLYGFSIDEVKQTVVEIEE